MKSIKLKYFFRKKSFLVCIMISSLGTNTDLNVNLFFSGNEIGKSQEVDLLGRTIDDKLGFLKILKIFAEKQNTNYTQFFFKHSVLSCAINLNVCREIVNLSTKKFFFITHMTTCDELFSMNSDVKIHQRHLHFLVTEVFKSVNNDFWIILR